MVEDAPQDLVHDLLSEAVFHEHPLGRPVIGRAEVISSIGRRSVSAYHRGSYVAGNIVLAAAGNLEHDAVVNLLERSARHRVEPPAKRTKVRTPLVREPAPSMRFQRKDTEQFHVCVGAPGIARSDRRRFAASLLDAILGGSASSRLFQEIREKRGMAYSVYSFALPVHRHGPRRDLRRHTRGEPRVLPRDRRRRDRRHRCRQPARARAGAGEGEPEGPDRALDGVDVEPDEPARPFADHRHRAALARPDHRRDRRGRARSALRAGRRAARPGADLGGGDRPGARTASERRSSESTRGSRSRREGRRRSATRGRSARSSPTGSRTPATRCWASRSGTRSPRLARRRSTSPSRTRWWGTSRRRSSAGCRCVVGTTGWESERERVDALAKERGVPVFVAPNFSIGAVLMMRFAAEAARHLPRAEIVELHNEAKKDAPSGTAKATAEAMGGDPSIHSVRLPGLVAHQEVLLAGEGQLLTIRHDTLSREVLRARRAARPREAPRSPAGPDGWPRRAPLSTITAMLGEVLTAIVHAVQGGRLGRLRPVPRPGAASGRERLRRAGRLRDDRRVADAERRREVRALLRRRRRGR